MGRCHRTGRRVQRADGRVELAKRLHGIGNRDRELPIRAFGVLGLVECLRLDVGLFLLQLGQAIRFRFLSFFDLDYHVELFNGRLQLPQPFELHFHFQVGGNQQFFQLVEFHQHLLRVGRRVGEILVAEIVENLGHLFDDQLFACFAQGQHQPRGVIRFGLLDQLGQMEHALLQFLHERLHLFLRELQLVGFRDRVVRFLLGRADRARADEKQRHEQGQCKRAEQGCAKQACAMPDSEKQRVGLHSTPPTPKMGTQVAAFSPTAGLFVK